MPSESRTAIYAGFASNVLNTATKFAAAFATASSAMVAEGVHSLVDASDGLLLLLGQKRAARPPDENHPLGHGKELYFWSLIVAISFFAFGSGMSFYEGIKHVMHPEPLSNPKWNHGVLGASALFTFGSFAVAFRAFRKRMGADGFWKTFRQSKDPTVFTLVLEDMADMAGLLLAFLGVFLSHRLDMPVLDGVASMGIGGVMAVVAVILARESKGLLVGESATPEERQAIRDAAGADADVVKVGKIVTQYLRAGNGPCANGRDFR